MFILLMCLKKGEYEKSLKAVSFSLFHFNAQHINLIRIHHQYIVALIFSERDTPSLHLFALL